MPAATKQAIAKAIPAIGSHFAAFLPILMRRPFLSSSFSFLLKIKLALRFINKVVKPEIIDPIMPGTLDKLLLKSFDTSRDCCWRFKDSYWAALYSCWASLISFSAIANLPAYSASRALTGVPFFSASAIFAWYSFWRVILPCNAFCNLALAIRASARAIAILSLDKPSFFCFKISMLCAAIWASNAFSLILLAKITAPIAPIATSVV